MPPGVESQSWRDVPIKGPPFTEYEFQLSLI